MSGALRSLFPSDSSAQVPNSLPVVAVAKLPLETQQELRGYAGWIWPRELWALLASLEEAGFTNSLFLTPSTLPKKQAAQGTATKPSCKMCIFEIIT